MRFGSVISKKLFHEFQHARVLLLIKCGGGELLCCNLVKAQQVFCRKVLEAKVKECAEIKMQAAVLCVLMVVSILLSAGIHGEHLSFMLEYS